LSGESKDIFILGGPNGAGKTTAARVLLPRLLHADRFLNADEIARRLSPEDVEAAALQAGRIFLEKMQEHIFLGQSFAIETTCAGRSYLRQFQTCKRTGWRISLLYLWVPSPEYSVERVNRRVRQGGHAIPEETIRRRYFAGLWNMRHLYLPLADDATIYDNRDGVMRLVARRGLSGPLKVVYPEIWTKIEEDTECQP